MRAKLVNERVKHLAPRTEAEIQSHANWRTKEFLEFLKANNIQYIMKPEFTKHQDLVKFKWNGVYYAIWIYWEMATLRRDVQDPMKPWPEVNVNTVTKAIEYLEKQKVNESIKHLPARPTSEIIDNIEKTQNLGYRMYMGLTNNLEDVVEKVLDEHKVKGNQEEDPIYMLGSFFLTNEELSFAHTGSWYFDSNGKMVCKEFDGEIDELCVQFMEFLEKHDIKHKQIGKSGYFNTRVQFTGNARDIIQLVLEFFVSHIQRYEYDLDQAYDIIFTG